MDAFASAILDTKQELQAEHMNIEDVIAQGGFGRVYRGAWQLRWSRAADSAVST